MFQWKVIYLPLTIFLTLFSQASIYADSVVWNPNGEEAGFTLDIPPEWEKDYEIKSNGVVFQAKSPNALINVKSFTLVKAGYELEELLTMRAARLSGRYSSISLVQKKNIDMPVHKIIALWRLIDKNQTYLEKNVIIMDNAKVLIMTCRAREKDYSKNQVVFENAVISLRSFKSGEDPEPVGNRFDIIAPIPVEKQPQPEPSIEPKTDPETTPATQPDTTPTGEQIPEMQGPPKPAPKPAAKSDISPGSAEQPSPNNTEKKESKRWNFKVSES